MDTIDVNKVLPNNLILNSVETHLYRIGLCPTDYHYIKPNRLHNPLLIFIVCLLSIFKNINSLLLSEENERLLIISGDFSHYLGIKTHYNIACGLYISLALTSQLIHFFNCKNDIKPNYLKVFEMMSGLVSPNSIGLSDTREIYKLIKLSKTLFLICELIIDKSVFMFNFILSIVLFILNCSLMDIFIFGILHSLLYALISYYVLSFILWQVVYFYLICYYIKIKLKQTNEKISPKTFNTIKSVKNYIR